MSRLNPTEQQQQVLDTAGCELAVSAAAGSGKTAVLVEKVLRMALGTAGESQVPLDRMLVITFTRAAARELKFRINESLQERRSELLSGETGSRNDVELASIRKQLEALPRAQISTMDSFFLDVVRRYGHIRGLSFDRMLTEDESRLLKHDIANQLLEEHFAAGHEGFTELALAWGGSDGMGPEDLASVNYESGIRQYLLLVHNSLSSLVDPEGWAAAMLERGWLDEERCDPQHPLIAGINEMLGEWAAEWIRRDSVMARRLELDAPDSACLQIIRERRLHLERSWSVDSWESISKRLNGFKDASVAGYPRLNLTSSSKAGIDDALLIHDAGKHSEAFKNSWDKWRDVFSPDWTVIARRQNRVQQHIRCLLELEAEFSARFRGYKQQQRVADFSDLARGALHILAAADDDGSLICGADGMQASAAADELQSRFDVVIVDEYQDTNELQDAVVNLVTRSIPMQKNRSTRSQFVVGDTKQSIYGFRLADPEVFIQRISAIKDGVRAGTTLKLTKNFRSRKAVLDGINWLFDGLLTEDFGGEDYSLNRLEAGLDYAKLFKEAGHPSFEDSPVELQLVDCEANEAEFGEDDPPSTMEAVYQRVADEINGITASKQQVLDKRRKQDDPERVRDVRWRDIVVLLRTATGRIETLRNILMRNGIDSYISSRSGFYERPEVSDGLSLLRIIDNPRQDVPLAAVLTGPAVQLHPTELFRVTTHGEKQLNLWDRVIVYEQAGEDQGIREKLGVFLQQYSRWRDAAGRTGLGELTWHIFRDSGLLAAASAMSGPVQRLANLERLLGLAQAADRNERRGLSRFLRFIDMSRQAKGDAGEPPVLGEDENVVRIMTVHDSKGQEFPVVIIPDIHSEFNDRDLKRDLIVDRRAGFGGRNTDVHASPPERTSTLGYEHVKEARRRDMAAEQLRLLYVAMTRARERLVLVSAIDTRKLNRISSGVDAPQAKSWLEWIGPRLAESIRTVSEGLQPGLVDTGSGWIVASRADESKADSADRVKRDKSAAQQEFKQALKRITEPYPFEQMTGVPLKATVTSLAKAGSAIKDDDASPVPSAGYSGRIEPGSAAKVGLAVHSILEQIDFSRECSVGEVEAIAAGLGESGLIEQEILPLIDAAAISTAADGISELVGQGWQDIYRELPAGMLSPPAHPPSHGGLVPEDSVYVQGVIDLLLVSDGRALIIDYKTDRGVTAEQLLERYRRQLEWYCGMVSAMLPDHVVEWTVCHVGGSGIIGPFEYPGANASGGVLS